MSKTATEIDKEITDLAEKMTKSVTDSKQLLFDTIMNLGPEGLKKASEDLNPEQKELLKSCIADMKKAQEVSADITPKKTETDAAKMKTESLSGSDDEDEKKLMDDKNASHPHQGGPKDKPEGWEGQVIKSDSKAVDALIQIEEAEHGKDIDGDGKVAEKLEKDKKEKKMKKALAEIVEMAKSLKMSKEEVVKAIKDAKEDFELVKGEMKKKLLAEESQVEMGGQDKGADAKQEGEKDPKDLKIEAETTADEVKVKKSVVWNRKSSIAANTLGRNTHWDVDAHIIKSEAEKQEIIKKGGYFGETEGEPLKKSENQKADLNDLIEKGFDYSTDEVKRIEGIKNHKIEGTLVKSFYDKDIAAALGLTEEEAKKLLGE